MEKGRALALSPSPPSSLPSHLYTFFGALETSQERGGGEDGEKERGGGGGGGKNNKRDVGGVERKADE